MHRSISSITIHMVGAGTNPRYSTMFVWTRLLEIEHHKPTPEAQENHAYLNFTTSLSKSESVAADGIKHLTATGWPCIVPARKRIKDWDNSASYVTEHAEIPR